MRWGTDRRTVRRRRLGRRAEITGAAGEGNCGDGEGERDDEEEEEEEEETSAEAEEENRSFGSRAEDNCVSGNGKVNGRPVEEVSPSTSNEDTMPDSSKGSKDGERIEVDSSARGLPPIGCTSPSMEAGSSGRQRQLLRSLRQWEATSFWEKPTPGQQR